MTNIELKEIGEIASTIHHYQEIINYFHQLVSDTPEKLKEYWETKISPKSGNHLVRYWNDVNLHLVSQMWGNTSGGWQGIGGNAMTTGYTIIIENNWFGLAYIYYEGQLAYVCEMDEKYDEYKKQSYRGLPGRRDCQNLLNVLSCKK